MYNSQIMSMNRMPYPPLWPMLMVPFLATGLLNIYLRIVQALLYPTVLLFAVWLAIRFGKGNLHGLIVGLALLATPAYMDMTIQVRPESLDALLWLILTFALLTDKYKTTIAATVLGAYNHSFASLFFNGGSVLAQKNKRQILTIVLLVAPIVGISLYYIVGYTQKMFLVAQGPQASWFLHSPVTFLGGYFGVLTLGLAFLVYQLFTWKQQTKLNKLCAFTILSCTPLLIIWLDRWTNYISIPMAILMGSFVSEHRKTLWFMVPLLAMYLFLTYIATVWFCNMVGGWDFHLILTVIKNA